MSVERPCAALLLASASGPLVIAVNEKTIYPPAVARDEPGNPAQAVARCTLVKGRNRILLLSRRGTAPWFYSIQIAPLAVAAGENPSVAAKPKK